MEYAKFIVTFLLVSCFSCQSTSTKEQPITDYTIRSPLGKKLSPATPPPKLLEKYEQAKKDYLKDKHNVENIIWLGRRTAYLGRLKEAIQIYTDGIAKFPADARLYRHRGHRYISIREYDKAIQDFQKAVQLIE